jgi:hypothetical protein
VPYIMMHMRGDPGSMQRTEHTSYGDVCADVGRELQAAADAASSAGIEPWRLVLDPGKLPLLLCSDPGCHAPHYVWVLTMHALNTGSSMGSMPAGIGFAKTGEGNCQLMAGLRRIRQQLAGPLHAAPLLVGPSRKGFLGRITGGWPCAPSTTKALRSSAVNWLCMHAVALLPMLVASAQAMRRQRRGTLLQQQLQRSAWQMAPTLCGRTMCVLCGMQCEWLMRLLLPHRHTCKSSVATELCNSLR